MVIALEDAPQKKAPELNDLDKIKVGGRDYSLIDEAKANISNARATYEMALKSYVDERRRGISSTRTGKPQTMFERMNRRPSRAADLPAYLLQARSELLNAYRTAIRDTKSEAGHSAHHHDAHHDHDMHHDHEHDHEHHLHELEHQHADQLAHHDATAIEHRVYHFLGDEHEKDEAHAHEAHDPIRQREAEMLKKLGIKQAKTGMGFPALPTQGNN